HLAVQPAAWPRFGRGRGLRSFDRAELPGRLDAAGDRAHADARGEVAVSGRSPDPAERVGEVAVDVEVAGHVRARKADLAGRPQDPAQRIGGVEDDSRRV